MAIKAYVGEIADLRKHPDLILGNHIGDQVFGECTHAVFAFDEEERTSVVHHVHSDEDARRVANRLTSKDHITFVTEV